MKKLFLLLLCLLIAMPIAFAQDKPVELYDFYGQGCPHCAKLHTFLEGIKDTYPTLKVIEKEVYFNQTNRNLMNKIASAYGIEIKGVPTVFIDNKVISGFSDSIGQQIENEIKRCVKEGCISPIDYGNSSAANQTGTSDKMNTTLTIGAVILGAFSEFLNPCLLSVLIILLTTIISTGNKRKALFVGLAFTLAIYISYFLMGVGFLTAIKATGIAHWFNAVVGIAAIFVGLFNMKDYFWYGKWFVMEVPMKWRPRMKVLLKSVTSVPGAFLIGFIISLFLLPCASGPYFVILTLLAKAAERMNAMLLLLLYNFIVILPMLALTIAISYGFLTTEQAEHWRTKKLKILHLIAGIIIFGLGIWMIVSIFLGAI